MKLFFVLLSFLLFSNCSYTNYASNELETSSVVTVKPKVVNESAFENFYMSEKLEKELNKIQFTSTKILRVHVDCKDKTYDAKGDGKGWRKLVLQENVLNSAKEPCFRSGYVIDSNNYVFKSETRNPISQYSTNPQKFTYEVCLKDSINQLRGEKGLSLQNPQSIGFSSIEQVNAYYLQLRSKIPNICEQLNSTKYSGLSKIEIELSLWDPMKLQAIEYVMKNINNCKKN